MKSLQQSNTTSFPVYVPLLAVFVLLLGTLNHVLMSWIWVLCACAIVIAILRVRRTLPSIKNVTLNLLAVFCMLLLVFLSDDFGLMATMVNLLVVAGCLKLINMQSSNDYYLMLIIQVLLIVCGLVYHQNLSYMIGYFLLIIMLLITAFIVNRGVLTLSDSYKQSIKIIAQAIPITLALFVVTPRLPPFWQMLVDKSAQTGLSENLTPGDIANLAKTDDLVFRAEFKDKIPKPEQRYWRSIVLDYFDGKTWSIAENALTDITLDTLKQEGNNYQYLVMAEPNNTKWLYSLDIPVLQESVSVPTIKSNWQYQLYKPDISTKPSLYIVKSFYEAPLALYNSNVDASRYLQVPDNANPRTRDWMFKNIDNKMSFDTKLSVLNNYFTSQNFRYTLHPPLMPSQVIDTFLFDYQQGFCSHYASSLTYMLRLANIPARMITGYQGGELENDQIISVRQYDAHAWVEAYKPDVGWVRLDPTALIAPNRTLSGLMSSLSEHESQYFNHPIGSMFAGKFFEELRKTMAIIDFNWNTFVLGFSQDSQAHLIEKLFGEFNQKTLSIFLALSFLCIGLFLALVFIPYKKWFQFTRPNALDRVFRRLSSMGFTRYTHEPLHTFYARIEPQLDEHFKPLLCHFVQRYYQAHYQTNYQTVRSPHEQTLSQYKQDQALDSIAKNIVNYKPASSR